MFYLRDDSRPPKTSQFAFRVALMGGFALVMFSIIFFRLWYLQVLSGDKYLERAKNNQVRDIRVAAPRGQVLDRNGKVLVNNQTALQLQLAYQHLPRSKAKRAAELGRLAHVLHTSSAHILSMVHKSLKANPQSPVILRRDVPYPTLYYFQENQTRFRGVAVQRVFERHYPNGDLGAHLFGNVGEITQGQLKEPRYKHLRPGDLVGQSGVEYQYDRFLRGQAGATRVQVDALGHPLGQLRSKPPVSGDNLRLSIDSAVQRAGEQAMSSRGLPGGFVVMNTQDGEILGLGSYPTFDPSIFTHRITPAQYKGLTSENNGAPLADRAIQGLYPTGSTFKPITAVATLESGIITPETPIYDGGALTVGGISFKNAGGGSYGTLSLRAALQVSDDVFFYTLGLRADSAPGEPLQHWARELGIGQATGIDLPAEVSGLLPTPEWRNQLYRQHKTDRPWSVGDNINLSVGQGDLQADPLQMAVAYAAIANGGRIVRPHVGLRVENPAGQVLNEITPRPRRRVTIKPAYSQAILDGLHLAAQAPGGTSYKVFGSFPIPVAGKTGTAQRFGQNDQSWYLVMAPYPHPRVVVAVTMERGGFGVDSAAPAAEEILSSYFNVVPGQRIPGQQGTSAPQPQSAVSTPGPIE